MVSSTPTIDATKATAAIASAMKPMLRTNTNVVLMPRSSGLIPSLA